MLKLLTFYASLKEKMLSLSPKKNLKLTILKKMILKNLSHLVSNSKLNLKPMDLNQNLKKKRKKMTKKMMMVKPSAKLNQALQIASNHIYVISEKYLF